MAQAAAKALQSSLSKLQISSDARAIPKIKKNAPVDSWEDEADESSADTETESTPVFSDSSPAPPPPTPTSSSLGSSHAHDKTPYRALPPFGLDGTLDGDLVGETNSPPRRMAEGDERRPEKSTAVASRLIAAGIGQKAPKRTKEQREYDQAMKLQERKKREQAKEEEQRKIREKEKALKDVWGD